MLSSPASTIWRAWSKAVEFTSPNTCSAFTKPVCWALSVCKIASMPMDRASFCFSRGRQAKTSRAGLRKISNIFAQCIISNGAVSLYTIASSCDVCTKKSLLTPRWPTSWATALTNKVNSSNHENTLAPAPKVLNIPNNVCVTSTACAQLWYWGPTKYFDAVSSTNAAMTSRDTCANFRALLASAKAVISWRCCPVRSKVFNSQEPKPNSSNDAHMALSPAVGHSKLGGVARSPSSTTASRSIFGSTTTSQPVRNCSVCVSCGDDCLNKISLKAPIFATTRSSTSVSCFISSSALLLPSQRTCDSSPTWAQFRICAWIFSTLV
mmetsp:Transcript_49889/g.140382  ORF Transcript_49889/g.140382 Transcript_49889/m.140382 type:complete len:323 (+) Transcript_49889:3-971(+)